MHFNMETETVDVGGPKKWMWTEKVWTIAQIQGRELWKIFEMYVTLRFKYKVLSTLLWITENRLNRVWDNFEMYWDNISYTTNKWSLMGSEHVSKC